MDFKNAAINLHKNNVVIDTHLDLAGEIYNRYLAGEKEVIKNRYLESFRKGGFNIIVSSLFMDDIFLPEMGLRVALGQINALMEDIETCDGEVVLIKSKEQLNHCIRENKIGIILSFEGLDPIGNDIGLLRIFYELGVRAAGLVWSRRNYVADGCSFNPVEEGQRGGLSRFGVKVVKRMEELNMLIDVSHLNDEGFWDIVKFTDKPFIASHSNARTLHGRMRNLTDEQIKAIAERNGVIGINAYKNIAGVGEGEDPIKKLADHIEYMVKLVGASHVGYGFDLCNSYYESEMKFKFEPFNSDSLSSHADAVLLTEEILKRGISEDDAKLIIGGNFLRVFNDVLQ
ncbi:membrane dipeptidase [Sedimentibacter hydroxybenzoicus DSM 7310]|uniref:Membrane dipeptidase n=1 Tax=Sedimentibacter hydroxybenzoicus DSM 7310 TaxID=1123245 RepID=A0A974BLS4_SEDHY|nr:membrane dipeptidase [Sedimentibacter hydroxybenzoicus]NYB75719.1 membrane dipeptidase [Sedimentibacter hydroxybenzoicus DSM 7310]